MFLCFRGKRYEAAQRPYVLMSLCPFVSRVSGCQAPLRRQPLCFLRPPGRQSVAVSRAAALYVSYVAYVLMFRGKRFKAAQRPYVLMSLCSYVSRVSGCQASLYQFFSKKIWQFTNKCLSLHRLKPQRGMASSPDGGIGRRAGLKHQWGNPCRFDPGSGYAILKG